jgi:hypothetical protein
VIPEPTGEAWTDNYIRVQLPLADGARGLIQAKVWAPEMAAVA